MKTMKKAFTLIELLVVIGIICILTSILVTSFSSGAESAREATCLANLKNLANACQSYAMESKYYPLAGNKTYLSIDDSNGTRDVRKKYTECPGWISTMTQGFYPGVSYKKGTPVGLYTEEEESRRYALTNGVLWKYVASNPMTYVCPHHANKAKKMGLHPNWSYAMSAYFGWDSASRAGTGNSGRVAFGSLTRADKILLFAELPFSGYNGWQPEGTGGSEDTDAILQYSSAGVKKDAKGANAGAGGSEELGVNHKRGRNAFTHVAFADGHVEKLQVPVNKQKPDTTQMKQLATWLATGVDVSFDGKKYIKLEN